MGGGGGKGELLRPHVEASELADLNEDDNQTLIRIQPVILRLLAFHSTPNIAASTPAAKHHQMIVIIGKLAG